MQFAKFSVLISLLALVTTSCTKYSSNPAATVNSNVIMSVGELTDINTGVPQDVSTGWIKMGTSIYFINHPTVNPGHQIWKSSSSGSATLIVDLGTQNYVTSLLIDTRTTATPTRFYFVVNGTQLWTSNGTTTSKIAEYSDGGGIVTTSAMNNDLYYQVNGTGTNGKVYKSSAGGTPAEVLAAAATSYAVGVTFLPASTHMYIYNTAANVTVYSHSGTTSIATNAGALTAANTVTQATVIGDNLYFQESATFKIFKSVAGAAFAEVQDDTAASFAGAASIVGGSTHAYIILAAANSGVYSHTGAAGSSTLIDTTTGGDTVTQAKVVADDLYYQYSGAGSFKVEKSVGGLAVQEVKDDTGTSFAAAILTLAGSSHMYIYHAAANVSVYSHSGGGANSTLVTALTAANTVTNPTIMTDDIYYQESATFKVFKSVTGAIGGQVTDNTATSFAAAVSFVPGTSVMYIHGNVSGGNARFYSHTGIPGIASVVLNGAVGTFNSAKMKANGNNLYFQGATTSPTGLFESIAGAAAVVVGDYTPSADDDSLCVTAYTPVAIGASLFFVANNGTKGCELWMTSGSQASTHIVSDVNSGQISSDPTSLTVVGTRVYFVAKDNSVPASPSNTYLFYSDTPYTTATKVILTGADAAPNPVYLTAVGTKLYFGAQVGGSITLFEHSGTSTGAASIKQTAGAANLIMDSGTPPFILAVGTKAYIRAAPQTTVYDVYISDSTAAVAETPAYVKHINSSAVTSSNPTLFKGGFYGTEVFFSADDGTGVELWKTDGTLAGTTQIRNFNGNATASANSNPSQLTFVGSTLYLTATDNIPTDGGPELYVTAYPWTATTKLTFRATNPRVTNLNALGNYLIFTMSEDGTAANSGIYRTDGTIANTIRIRAPGGVAAPTFNTVGQGVTNGFLFFAFQSNTTIGSQLFNTDGTVSGTALVKGINPSPFSTPVDELAAADVANFSVVNSFLIFPGNDGTTGKQLWYSNGYSWGTGQVANFTPLDNAGSAPALLGVAGSASYYVLRDTNHGRSIYKISAP